jgi:asparagine synthase (glutamine-hydrolysing)
MCGIAGIASSNYRELGPLLKEMLGAMRHRGPDGAGLVIGDYCERGEHLDALNFDGKKGHSALGHVRLAITGGRTGLQPFTSRDGTLSLLHNGEIYNYRELSSEMTGDVTTGTGSDSEVVMRLIEREYAGDLAGAVERVLPRLDGVYALALTDGRQTVVARDRIGVRQLYYYAGRGLVGFASEKKPLIALGGNGIDIHRLSPGHLMVIEGGGFERRAFWSPEVLREGRMIADKGRALAAYDVAMRSSVQKRIAGRDRVGIIFSGGVDSFLIVHLVRQLGVPFTCYTAGRETEAPDLDWAVRTAEEHDFPLMVKRLRLEDIERRIPQVIHDIEDNSLNQVEVAIPIHASVEMARNNGERVILNGQGADELFGGYPWYPKVVDREGYYGFVKRSWEDTCVLYKECLEREDKIAMSHSIELRVPFLDPEVIRIAFSIAPELKIAGGEDRLGKRVHREYCRSIGIPERIAYRPKEAAQHGANVHHAFEEIAESRGLTHSLMNEVGYDPDRTVTEKLGSSSRYGFRYGEEHLWKPLPHVQYFLDYHAAKLGLLGPLPRFHFEDVQRRLAGRGLAMEVR